LERHTERPAGLAQNFVLDKSGTLVLTWLCDVMWYQSVRRMSTSAVTAGAWSVCGCVTDMRTVPPVKMNLTAVRYTVK